MVLNVAQLPASGSLALGGRIVCQAVEIDGNASSQPCAVVVKLLRDHSFQIRCTGERIHKVQVAANVTGEPAATPARTWRERAVECRREAAANRNPGSVEAWLRLAQRYEKMAERAEIEAVSSAQSKSG
jgi:hypothetical protein